MEENLSEGSLNYSQEEKNNLLNISEINTEEIKSKNNLIFELPYIEEEEDTTQNSMQNVIII